MSVDGDRLSQIEGRLEQAAQATTDLRLSVESLRDPLATLAEIKQENQEIKRKADAATAAAAETERVSQERARRGRRTLLVGGALALALLLVATFATFTALIGYVQGLLQEEQAGRYRSCLTRNAAVSVQVRREAILAGIDEMSPAERKAHLDSARELQVLLVNCDQYRRP